MAKTVNDLLADLTAIAMLGGGKKEVLIYKDELGLRVDRFEGQIFRPDGVFAVTTELPDGITPEDVTKNCVVISL